MSCWTRVTKLLALLLSSWRKVFVPFLEATPKPEGSRSVDDRVWVAFNGRRKNSAEDEALLLNLEAMEPNDP